MLDDLGEEVGELPASAVLGVQEERVVQEGLPQESLSLSSKLGWLEACLELELSLEEPRMSTAIRNLRAKGTLPSAAWPTGLSFAAPPASSAPI